MGTEVVIDPIVIEPPILYLTTVERWLYLPGSPRCGGTFDGKVSNIIPGVLINAWLDAGHECTLQTLISPPLQGWAERLFSAIEV